MTQFMTPKGHMVIRGHCDLLYDLKAQYDQIGLTQFMTSNVTGSLEVAVTYLITPKVTVTFVVGLT